MQAPDAVLAARLCAGDDEALAEAFDRCAPAVYASAVRVLGPAAAEDVVQDVFVQLWTRPDRYDPTASPLRAYLVMLARNRALDVLRSDLRRIGRHERHHRLSPDAPTASTVDDVAKDVVTADAARLVQDAVRQLPPDQRRVVELAYFQGLSYREVAVAAGIPEGTAKSRLRAALARLEQILDRQLLDPA